jgi:hypothetical protein
MRGSLGAGAASEGRNDGRRAAQGTGGWSAGSVTEKRAYWAGAGRRRGWRREGRWAQRCEGWARQATPGQQAQQAGARLAARLELTRAASCLALRACSRASLCLCCQAWPHAAAPSIRLPLNASAAFVLPDLGRQYSLCVAFALAAPRAELAHGLPQPVSRRRRPTCRAAFCYPARAQPATPPQRARWLRSTRLHHPPSALVEAPSR